MIFIPSVTIELVHPRGSSVCQMLYMIRGVLSKLILPPNRISRRQTEIIHNRQEFCGSRERIINARIYVHTNITLLQDPVSFVPGITSLF